MASAKEEISEATAAASAKEEPSEVTTPALDDLNMQLQPSCDSTAGEAQQLLRLVEQEMRGIRRAVTEQQRQINALSFCNGLVVQAQILFREHHCDLDTQHRTLCDCLHKTGLLHRGDLLAHWQAHKRRSALADLLDEQPVVRTLLLCCDLDLRLVGRLSAASKAAMDNLTCSLSHLAADNSEPRRPRESFWLNRCARRRQVLELRHSMQLLPAALLPALSPPAPAAARAPLERQPRPQPQSPSAALAPLQHMAPPAEKPLAQPALEVPMQHQPRSTLVDLLDDHRIVRTLLLCGGLCLVKRLVAVSKGATDNLTRSLTDLVAHGSELRRSHEGFWLNRCSPPRQTLELRLLMKRLPAALLQTAPLPPVAARGAPEPKPRPQPPSVAARAALQGMAPPVEKALAQPALELLVPHQPRNTLTDLLEYRPIVWILVRCDDIKLMKRLAIASQAVKYNLVYSLYDLVKDGIGPWRARQCVWLKRPRQTLKPRHSMHLLPVVRRTTGQTPPPAPAAARAEPEPQPGPQPESPSVVPAPLQHMAPPAEKPLALPAVEVPMPHRPRSRLADLLDDHRIVRALLLCGDLRLIEWLAAVSKAAMDSLTRSLFDLVSDGAESRRSREGVWLNPCAPPSQTLDLRHSMQLLPAVLLQTTHPAFAAARATLEPQPRPPPQSPSVVPAPSQHMAPPAEKPLAQPAVEVLMPHQPRSTLVDLLDDHRVVRTLLLSGDLRLVEWLVAVSKAAMDKLTRSLSDLAAEGSEYRRSHEGFWLNRCDPPRQTLELRHSMQLLPAALLQMPPPAPAAAQATLEPQPRPQPESPSVVLAPLQHMAPPAEKALVQPASEVLVPHQPRRTLIDLLDDHQIVRTLLLCGDLRLVEWLAAVSKAAMDNLTRSLSDLVADDAWLNRCAPPRHTLELRHSMRLLPAALLQTTPPAPAVARAAPEPQPRPQPQSLSVVPAPLQHMAPPAETASVVPAPLQDTAPPAEKELVQPASKALMLHRQRSTLVDWLDDVPFVGALLCCVYGDIRLVASFLRVSKVAFHKLRDCSAGIIAGCEDRRRRKGVCRSRGAPPRQTLDLRTSTQSLPAVALLQTPTPTAAGATPAPRPRPSSSSAHAVERARAPRRVSPHLERRRAQAKPRGSAFSRRGRAQPPPGQRSPAPPALRAPPQHIAPPAEEVSAQPALALEVPALEQQRSTLAGLLGEHQIVRTLLLCGDLGLVERLSAVSKAAMVHLVCSLSKVIAEGSESRSSRERWLNCCTPRRQILVLLRSMQLQTPPPATPVAPGTPELRPPPRPERPAPSAVPATVDLMAPPAEKALVRPASEEDDADGLAEEAGANSSSLLACEDYAGLGELEEPQSCPAIVELAGESAAAPQKPMEFPKPFEDVLRHHPSARAVAASLGSPSCRRLFLLSRACLDAADRACESALQAPRRPASPPLAEQPPLSPDLRPPAARPPAFDSREPAAKALRDRSPPAEARRGWLPPLEPSPLLQPPRPKPSRGRRQVRSPAQELAAKALRDESPPAEARRGWPLPLEPLPLLQPPKPKTETDSPRFMGAAAAEPVLLLPVGPQADGALASARTPRGSCLEAFLQDVWQYSSLADSLICSMGLQSVQQFRGVSRSCAECMRTATSARRATSTRRRGGSCDSLVAKPLVHCADPCQSPAAGGGGCMAWMQQVLQQPNLVELLALAMGTSMQHFCAVSRAGEECFRLGLDWEFRDDVLKLEQCRAYSRTCAERARAIWAHIEATPSCQQPPARGRGCLVSLQQLWRSSELAELLAHAMGVTSVRRFCAVSRAGYQCMRRRGHRKQGQLLCRRPAGVGSWEQLCRSRAERTLRRKEPGWFRHLKDRPALYDQRGLAELAVWLGRSSAQSTHAQASSSSCAAEMDKQPKGLADQPPACAPPEAEPVTEPQGSAAGAQAGAEDPAERQCPDAGGHSKARSPSSLTSQEVQWKKGKEMHEGAIELLQAFADSYKEPFEVWGVEQEFLQESSAPKGNIGNDSDKSDDSQRFNSRGSCRRQALDAPVAAVPPLQPEPPSGSEELHRGDSVQLHGMKTRQDLNGFVGKLVSYAAEGCRWNVALANGEAVRIRASNLRLLPRQQEQRIPTPVWRPRNKPRYPDLVDRHRNFWRILRFTPMCSRLAFAAASRDAHDVASMQGRVYVCGGTDGQNIWKSAECLDLTAGHWTRLPPMATERSDAGHATLCGRLYMVGGTGREAILDSVERFDPASGSWQAMPPMSRCRSFPMAGVLKGRVYVCGGCTLKEDSVVEPGQRPTPAGTTSCTTGGLDTRSIADAIQPPTTAAGAGLQRGNLAALSSMECLDPQRLQWQGMPSMKTGRYSAVVAAIGGLLYIVGGTGGTGPSELSVVEAFDPDENTWHELADMTGSRSFAASAQMDGFLYIMGGMNHAKLLKSAERYSFRSGKWEILPSMYLERYGGCAHAMPQDGRIYVCGGGRMCSAMYSLEAFSPADNHWELLRPMSQSRCLACAVAVAGYLYILGGSAECDSSGSVRHDTRERDPSRGAGRVMLSAERLNLANGTSESLPAMDCQRLGAVAAFLPW